MKQRNNLYSCFRRVCSDSNIRLSSLRAFFGRVLLRIRVALEAVKNRALIESSHGPCNGILKAAADENSALLLLFSTRADRSPVCIQAPHLVWHVCFGPLTQLYNAEAERRARIEAVPATAGSRGARTGFLPRSYFRSPAALPWLPFAALFFTRSATAIQSEKKNAPQSQLNIRLRHCRCSPTTSGPHLERQSPFSVKRAFLVEMPP